MQAERDYLIRQVFPVIRKACRERQVEFTEIDLRWGVTREEAEQGKVVRICLEEIDRCRPYFLSLLGERYGWAPQYTDLDHKSELLALFPFLENSLKEGLSVTEMEIIHGVINNPEMIDHSFFYLRSLELTELLGKQFSAPNDYTESDIALRQKLEQLKDKIRESGLPVRDNYQTVAELGELVKQDLLAVLDSSFPVDETPTPIEAERNAHRMYGQDRCHSYIANPDDLDVLDQHLESKRNIPLIVTGESGLGKSALLAYWSSLQLEKNPNQFLIEHYVGNSGDADPGAVIRRVMTEIKERYKESDELPSKPDEVIRDFPLWLAKVRENDPLLLVIDGLNQLETVDMRWLPEFWQANIRAVFSVIPGQQLNEMIANDWLLYIVKPLEIDRRERLISDWLARYRKTLSHVQTHKIAQAEQTGNPLFLKTVLEELRIFGYFEKLNERIDDLLQAEDLRALFVLVIDRLENDFGDELTKSILQLVWAARKGLSEKELTNLSNFNRITISSFLMAIDGYLAKRGCLITFFHSYFRQAVYERYFLNVDQIFIVHSSIASYFQSGDFDQRCADELPWQLVKSGRWDDLQKCITNIKNFLILYETNVHELVNYLRLTINCDNNFFHEYLKNMELWGKSIDVYPDDLAGAYFNISDLFYECWKSGVGDLGGSLNRIVNVAVKAVQLYEKILDENDPKLVSILIQGGYSYLRRGLESDYDIVGIYAKDAMEIAEFNYGKSSKLYSRAQHLLFYSLQGQGDLDAAESCLIELLNNRISIYGDGSPYLASTYGSLANLYHERKELHKAEVLYRKRLEINIESGKKDLDLVNSSLGLANCLKDQDKNYEEIKFLFENSLDTYKKYYSRNNDNILVLSGKLADVYRKISDYKSLAELYKWAEYGIGSVTENGLLDYYLTLNNIKELYQENKQLAESIVLDDCFEYEVHRLEQLLGDFDCETILQLNYYYEYLDSNNRVQDALSVFKIILNRVNKLQIQFTIPVLWCLVVSSRNLIINNKIDVALECLLKTNLLTEKVSLEPMHEFYRLFFIGLCEISSSGSKDCLRRADDLLGDILEKKESIVVGDRNLLVSSFDHALLNRYFVDIVTHLEVNLKLSDINSILNKIIDYYVDSLVIESGETIEIIDINDLLKSVIDA